MSDHERPPLSKGAQAALRERDKLAAAYRVHQRELRDELRARHPELMHAIDGQFRACSLINLPGLIEWILGNPEIARLEETQRPVLLRYLSARLTSLRESAGLPPFDDALPDDSGPIDPARDAYILFRRLLAGF